MATTSGEIVTVDRIAVEKAISKHNAVIIDARHAFQFELGHIPFALNIPYNTKNLNHIVQKHSLKNKWLIIYCSSVNCNAAEILAEKLLELGCKNVRVYPGGWEEWKTVK